MASITDTYTLSPSLVNQFVVGFHRSTSNQTYGNAFNFSSLGMNVPAQDDATRISGSSTMASRRAQLRRGLFAG